MWEATSGVVIEPRYVHGTAATSSRKIYLPRRFPCPLDHGPTRAALLATFQNSHVLRQGYTAEKTNSLTHHASTLNYDTLNSSPNADFTQHHTRSSIPQDNDDIKRTCVDMFVYSCV